MGHVCYGLHKAPDFLIGNLINKQSKQDGYRNRHQLSDKIDSKSIDKHPSEIMIGKYNFKVLESIKRT